MLCYWQVIDNDGCSVWKGAAGVGVTVYCRVPMAPALVELLRAPNLMIATPDCRAAGAALDPDSAVPTPSACV